MRQSTKEDLIKIFLILALIVGTFGAWLTHVITCIFDEKYLFLIAGAILAPIGIIHGWLIFLGFV